MEGEKSEWKECTARQTDVDDVVIAFIRKFADDTKLAKIVETDEDAAALTADVDRMSEWA